MPEVNLQSRAGLSDKTPILKHFNSDYTATDLVQEVDRVAFQAALQCPASAETTAGLRKLLEARDCFIRAQDEA